MTTTDNQYRAVLDQHQGLRNLLAEIEEVLGRPPEASARAGWLGGLGDKLQHLRGQLETHFVEEEEGGFFAEIESNWPNAAARCQRLLKQHENLLASLDELIQDTIARPTADQPFQTIVVGTCALVKELQHHESSENELFYEALEGGPAAQD